MSKYKKGSLGYLLELAKKDGFDNLKDWNEWRKKTGKMPDATEIKRKEKDEFYKRHGFKNGSEYEDYLAKKRGYKDRTEYKREWSWEKEIHIPISENKSCPSYKGICIGEDQIAEPILKMIFEHVEKMSYNNPGFEYICKNPIQEFIDKHPYIKLERNKEYKIDVKIRLLSRDNRWIFPIKFNNTTDCFLLIGAKKENDEEDIKPICVWLLNKEEIIRGRKLWKRNSLAIINKAEYLLQFKEYELKGELEKIMKNQEKGL